MLHERSASERAPALGASVGGCIAEADDDDAAAGAGISVPVCLADLLAASCLLNLISFLDMTTIP